MTQAIFCTSYIPNQQEKHTKNTSNAYRSVVQMRGFSSSIAEVEAGFDRSEILYDILRQMYR